MKAALFLILSAACSAALADNYVNGYMKRDGTYVAPHHKTNPDRNPYNNYSTQGNTNPYTGQQGTREPYQVQQQYNNHQPGYNANQYGGQQQRQRW